MSAQTLLCVVVCVCVVMCVCQNAKPASEAEVPPADQQERITLTPTYAHMNKDNNKLVVFIAAAVGTITLMAVIYCIYNQFYTKHPYSHTQLHETDISVDTQGTSSCVFGSCGGQTDGWIERGMGEGGSYGSLSDTPSIITLPPPLSPPPLASPLAPPRPLCPAPLRTISAQDLQKSFL